jgi:2-polyprenyl-3-methyl-5-hydroxy-6-metoxy-1,4-benzoquinol methylase
MQTKWEKAQKWEKNWHGKCLNKALGEYNHVKVIAPKLGLQGKRRDSRIEFDLEGKRVLDIGGGSSSILLKCINVKGKVVDPIKFPDWVYARYDCAGIKWEIKKGEDIDEVGYDEVWIYNCLQHVENPKRIIDNARKAGKLIRLYEYINIPKCEGHIHTLTREKLDQWLGGKGKVEGKRYYGVFPSNINTATYWDKIYRKEGKDTWRVKPKVNDYVLENTKGSVLELGCGVGVLARRINGDYLGLDISPEAVRLMREQGFNAEVRQVPPIKVDRNFDTVIGLELLEHLDEEDRLNTIKEASRVGKRSIFSVPNDCMPPEEVNEHRIVYNKDSLKGFLSTVYAEVDIKPISNYLVAICK